MAQKPKRKRVDRKPKADPVTDVQVVEPSVKSPVKPEADEDEGRFVRLEDGSMGALIRPDVLSAVKKLGLDVERHGALTLANGFALCTKSTLAVALEKMNGLLEKVKDEQTLITSARAIGYLANSMAKMIGEFRQTNAMKKPDGGPRNRSFTPGQLVVAIQNNIKTEPKE